MAEDAEQCVVNFRFFPVNSRNVRSILDAENIETVISEIVLAVYDAESGKLYQSSFFSPVSKVEMHLPAGTGYNVYAVANMGEAALPISEKEMEGFAYRIGSYGEIGRKGMPMCGKYESLVPGKTSECILVMERLMAKLRITIDHTGLTGEEGNSIKFKNLSLAIRQCNGTLYPFKNGGSRAISSGDLLQDEEGNFDMGAQSGPDGGGNTELSPGYADDSTFVFYVPENRMGVLMPDNTDPYLKTPEGLGMSGLDSKISGLATYAEFKGYYDGLDNGLEGGVTYRFYLGSDSVSDFNVERNVMYDIVLGFTESGLGLEGNWKVTKDDDWSDTRTLYFTGGPYGIYPGGTLDVEVFWNSMGTTDNMTGYCGKYWEYDFGSGAMSDGGLLFDFDPASNIFSFRASPDAAPGMSFPLRINTLDEIVSDNTTITVNERLPELEIIPDRDMKDFYVAQKAVLTVGGISPGRMLVAEITTGEGTVSINGEDLSSGRLVLSALKPGAASIRISSEDGLQEAVMDINVKKPYLKFLADEFTLSVDGAAVSCRTEYYKDSYGNEILTDFDSRLYESILKPVYSFRSGNNGYFAASRYNELYVRRLYDDSLRLIPAGSRDVDVLYADAVNCSAIDRASAQLNVRNPFPSPEGIIGEDVHCYYYAGSRGSLAFSGTVTADCDPDNLSWEFTGMNNEGVSFNYGNGVLDCYFPYYSLAQNCGTSTLMLGKAALRGYVMNSISGQKYSSGEYYFVFYQHGALGGKIVVEQGGSWTELTDWYSPVEGMTTPFHSLPSNLVRMSGESKYISGYYGGYLHFGTQSFDISEYASDNDIDLLSVESYMMYYRPHFMIMNLEKPGSECTVRPYYIPDTYLVVHRIGDLYEDTNGWLGL